MQSNEATASENADVPAPPAAITPSPTPLIWRLGIGVVIVALGLAAYALRDTIGPRGQAFAGLFCFFGLVAMFSSNLRAVNWRTIGWGIALQIILAVLVLKVPLVHKMFEAAKEIVNAL